mgnify:CR=1 FL=1
MKLTIDQIMQQAIKLHKEGKLHDAESFYKDILKTDPKNPNANYNLGIIAVSMNKPTEAILFFKTAVEVNPNREQFWISYITALINEKCFEEAEINFKKAIELNPNNENFYNNYANTLNELGKLEEAETNYKKAIELKPDFAEPYNNLGTAQRSLGKLDASEISFRKAIELNPDYIFAHNNLGNALQNLGKLDEAETAFRKAIELKQDYVEAHYNLIGVLFQLSKETSFFKELDEIIKLGKINAVFGSLLSRAEVKFKTKRPNLFCKNPLNYVLKTNLTESCDFKTIFVETAKKLLGNVNVKHKFQHLLTKGDQTAGNIFLKRDGFMNEIQKILRLEIEKYRTHFKDSEEGFLKNWPSKYDLNGWLIKMKSGGKLIPHIHESGWISGSVYINVPPKLKTDSGNLVVCIDEKNDLEENKKSIDVVTGSLCLFPSSLHHYTIPFESNEERIVLAFDVIPK